MAVGHSQLFYKLHSMSYYGHASATTPTSGGGGATHQHSQQQSNNNNHLDQGKIFVGGLSWSTTEESLRFHFEQYGPVESVQVMRDRNTGEPRGFGFVVFKSAETVDLVMKDVPTPGHEINHKLVDVKRAQARGVAPPSIHGGQQPQNQDPRGAAAGAARSHHGAPSNHQDNTENELTPEQLNNKVFVGGLPPHIDSEGMREIFEQFGKVTDSIVMVDQMTQRSRCFGFVTFENGSNGAQKVIEVQPITIEGKKVEVKLATPREQQPRSKAALGAAGPKHMGLRAGIGSSTGEYAGLAVAYGRSGWKAGYGTYAFGKAGWSVQGWEDIGVKIPERAGFSFDMLENPPDDDDDDDGRQPQNDTVSPPPSKKAKYDQ